MPISHNKLFKCTKCGYKENRIIGDVPLKSMLKPCPKCDAMMAMIGNAEYGIFEKIFDKIEKIFR